MEMRASYRDNPETFKNDGLVVDGFGSLDEYITSDLVEIIEFCG